MRIVQILHGKAHWIFEANEIPNWPPYPDGTPPLLIDITDKPEVQEGWLYDPETGEFSEPVYEEPEPVPIEPREPTLEEMQAQTLLNTEFLVVLAEITQM